MPFPSFKEILAIVSHVFSAKNSGVEGLNESFKAQVTSCALGLWQPLG